MRDIETAHTNITKLLSDLIKPYNFQLEIWKRGCFKKLSTKELISIAAFDLLGQRINVVNGTIVDTYRVTTKSDILFVSQVIPSGSFVTFINSGLSQNLAEGTYVMTEETFTLMPPFDPFVLSVLTTTEEALVSACFNLHHIPSEQLEID